MEHEPTELDKAVEIFSVHFTNIYWNNLYNESVRAQANHASLEESYRAAADYFNTAFCRRSSPQERTNKHYISIINTLRDSYNTYMNTDLSYTTFVLTIIQLLLPQDYRSMDNATCDSVFRNIITKTLTKFTVYVINSGSMRLLLSEDARRRPEHHMTTIKTQFAQLFYQERNEFTSLVVAGRSGINVASDSPNENMRKLIDKYNDKLKELIQEKAQITHERNKFLEALQHCTALMEEKDRLIEEKSALIKQLTAKPATAAAFSSVPMMVPAISATTVPQKIVESSRARDIEPSAPTYESDNESAASDVSSVAESDEESAESS